MKFLSIYKPLLIAVILTACVFIFSTCINNRQPSSGAATVARDSVTFTAFAGSAACAKCHQQVFNDYMQTAHFLTSQPAIEKFISGSFKKGLNTVDYGAGKIVQLEKRNDSFYQVYYHSNKEVVSRRFDIVIGSGVHGQTYLSWIGNHLIELPVSYFTPIQKWANSPGYPLSPIIFNRPVTARCLECHSTFAQTINYNPEVPPMFDASKMILTVGCEKCHGPAARHVAYQEAHPADTIGKFIVDPGRLSRQLQLDVCALCHNGKLQEKQAPFQFAAGDSLYQFYDAGDAARKAGLMDVHGNQLGVLSASKCFRLSKTMTCTTCHNPHASERGNTVLFSQRCQSCHTTQHKTIEGVTDMAIKNNCIDCHMPLQESTSISFLLKKDKPPVNAMMRTHYITIYKNETKKFVEQNSLSKKNNQLK
jgi:hypothetical protein